MNIQFSKYHGAGNDFILIDGRVQKFDSKNFNLLKKLCDRRFGIGADGVMVLLHDSTNDFKMLYFNSDGHEGTMCGNGGRCITSFAYSLGIINEKTRFSASDGIHEAIIEHDMVHLKMNDVSAVIKLEDGFLINTGSPHFIKIVNNPFEINVETVGREIRNQERFMPAGVNVNFVSFNNNEITISTYERGVEAETLSCGTGSVASAIACSHLYNNVKNSFKIIAKGGELNVSFKFANNIYTNVWLSGPAAHVFDGNVDLDKLMLFNS